MASAAQGRHSAERAGVSRQTRAGPAAATRKLPRGALRTKLGERTAHPPRNGIWRPRDDGLCCGSPGIEPRALEFGWGVEQLLQSHHFEKAALPRPNEAAGWGPSRPSRARAWVLFPLQRALHGEGVVLLLGRANSLAENHRRAAQHEEGEEGEAHDEHEQDLRPAEAVDGPIGLAAVGGREGHGGGLAPTSAAGSNSRPGEGRGGKSRGGCGAESHW